jgi:GT2 family glycosyltransferase
VSSTTQVEISVIVPVRNGARSVPALLRSLDTQTLERGRYEVIVVDNASTDGTAAMARAHGARVVHEPIANRSRARNRGASVATSRRYVFIDADCVADRRWLHELLAHAELAPLVAGEVRLRTSRPPNAVERFEALWRFAQGAWVAQGWAAAANLLVHADAFEAIDGFDVAYRHYGEDADFCLRAGRAGYDLGFCGSAVVEHDGEQEMVAFLRRFFMHGYGATQIFYRLGAGYRPWQNPRPAVMGDRALRELGHSPDRFERGEWLRMVYLARLGYGARIAGSIWAEVVRAR